MTDTHKKTWTDRYAALKEFVEREGHALVPSHHIESDINLGAWVSYLRTRYKQGYISPEKVVALESLPGWNWGPLRPGPKTNHKRNAEIRHLRQTGMSLSKIGDRYGISRQRVHQILETHS